MSRQQGIAAPDPIRDRASLEEIPEAIFRFDPEGARRADAPGNAAMRKPAFGCREARPALRDRETPRTNDARTWLV